LFILDHKFSTRNAKKLIKVSKGVDFTLVSCEIFSAIILSDAAMSNPNDLPSQKLCHYLNQGYKLNGLL